MWIESYTIWNKKVNTLSNHQRTTLNSDVPLINLAFTCDKILEKTSVSKRTLYNANYWNLGIISRGMLWKKLNSEQFPKKGCSSLIQLRTLRLTLQQLLRFVFTIRRTVNWLDLLPISKWSAFIVKYKQFHIDIRHKQVNHSIYKLVVHEVMDIMKRNFSNLGNIQPASHEWGRYVWCLEYGSNSRGSNYTNVAGKWSASEMRYITLPIKVDSVYISIIVQ